MPEIASLLANITPADLTNFAREVPIPQNLVLSTEILPQRTIDNVKYRLRDASLTVAAARYRSFNAPTPRLFTQGAQTITEGYLPPLGGKQEIEEMQVILDEISRGADDQRLLDALWNNVENQVTAIYTRLEVAAGDLLTDGVLTIQENGQVLEADFGVPSANKPVAATLWSDVDNATPLSDELAWIQVLADAGRPAPARALSSRQVWGWMLQSREYRETYWGGEVSGVSRPALTPAQFDSVRATYGLPPITLYDTQVAVANDSGVISSVRPLPANRYLLLPGDPSTNLGETLFGLTAEGIAFGMGSNPSITRQDRAGIVSSQFTEWDPVSVGSKTNAVAMPTIQVKNSAIFARVGA